MEQLPIELENMILDYKYQLEHTEKYDLVMKELKKINDKRTKISNKKLLYCYNQPIFRLRTKRIMKNEPIIIEVNALVIKKYCWSLGSSAEAIIFEYKNKIHCIRNIELI